MKLNKKDYIHISILIAFVLAYVLIITKNTYVYGSSVDWDAQHFTIPEYLRNLFYKTHHLIPSFAFNLGAGQNIFYLLYYGLLNPIVLISYLFPFIKMVDYIQASSILSIIISSIIFYKWILSKFNSNIAFLGSLIFISASPILFHSHRHIMFINYMPFLILAMIGIDKYFDEDKKTLLIISTFLIIMTSYFFSVSSILMITIYGIYKYIEKNQKVTLKSFIIDGMKYISTLVVSILMAALILLPTFYVLLNGRTDTNFIVELIDILKPSLSINRLFYGAYTPGITFLFVFVLMNYLINGKKEHKFLSITIILMLILPIFSYLLNATMYIDTKVFIPFVPLFSLMSVNAINDLENSKSSFKVLLITTIIGIIFLLFNINSNLIWLFIIDLILLISTISYFIIKKNKYVLYLCIIISSIGLFIFNLANDKLYPISKMEILENSVYNELIEKALQDEQSIYRLISDNNPLQNINRIYNIDHYSSTIYSSISNEAYKEFYYNYSGNEVNQRSYGKLSSSKNLFYNMYMGNKYHISNNVTMLGYKALYTIDSSTIYSNEHVLPIIYANSHILSTSEVDELVFPYNIDALIKYSVIESDNNKDHYVTNIQEIYPKYKIIETKNISRGASNSKYIIDSNNGYMKLAVNDFNQDEILIIKFTLTNNPSCSKGDIAITINGIKNVLTCSTWKYHNENYEFKYVISSNEKLEELNIEFSKGLFYISNIKTYKVNYKDLKDIRNSVDEFYFDKDKTVGNRIEGTIDVKQDGFLNINIPYDEGFKLYIDNKEVDYIKANYGFMGTPIAVGKHTIRLEYKAPLLRDGLLISGVGFTLLFVIMYKEMNKNKKKRKKRVA